jgi:hypothetical protein
MYYVAAFRITPGQKKGFASIIFANAFVHNSMVKALKRYPAEGRPDDQQIPAATVLAMYAAWHKLRQFGPATGFSPCSEVPALGLYDALLRVDNAFRFLRVGVTLEITTRHFWTDNVVREAIETSFARLDRNLTSDVGNRGAMMNEWGHPMEDTNLSFESSKQYFWVYKLRPVLAKTAPNDLYCKVIFRSDLQGYHGDEDGNLTFAYSCVTVADNGKALQFLGTHAAKQLPHDYRFLSSASDIGNLINRKNLREYPTATFKRTPIGPASVDDLTEIEPLHPVKSGALAVRHRVVDRFRMLRGRF